MTVIASAAPSVPQQRSGAVRTCRCLVVLPTYQEADNVGGMIEELLASPVGTHVLVVDDASPDGTADIADQIGLSHPGRVHVMRRAGPRGLGRAYRDGFAWALASDYDVIVQMDADGSHPVDRLDTIVGVVDNGADVAIGSRYVHGGAIEDWSLFRRALSRGGNAFARAVLGLQQTDVTGAYRAWSPGALRLCQSEASGTNGYGFMVEMAVRMKTNSLDVTEVPITFRDRQAGSSKMSARIALETLRMVVGMRLRRAGTSTSA